MMREARELWEGIGRPARRGDHATCCSGHVLARRRPDEATGATRSTAPRRSSSGSASRTSPTGRKALV